MNNQKNNLKAFQHPTFNPKPEWVPIAKRIRCFFNNNLVADSEQVMLKREFPMVYFFPHKDVKEEFFQKNDINSHADSWGKSDSRDIKADGKTAENAAWIYVEPEEAAPKEIGNYVAIKWEAMDFWFEEDEEVRVHPRDPYHRVDICNSSREIKIKINGETIAATHHPVVLFETGLPVRFYIRKTDINLKLLKATDHQTGCPYKGTASYYSVVSNGNILENIAWTYPFPNPEASKIKDMIAFYTEKMDEVYIDGKKLPEMK